MNLNCSISSSLSPRISCNDKDYLSIMITVSFLPYIFFSYSTTLFSHLNLTLKLILCVQLSHSLPPSIPIPSPPPFFFAIPPAFSIFLLLSLLFFTLSPFFPFSLSSSFFPPFFSSVNQVEYNNELITYIEKEANWSFPPGFAKEIPSARLTIDPVFATQRCIITFLLFSIYTYIYVYVGGCVSVCMTFSFCCCHSKFHHRIPALLHIYICVSVDVDVSGCCVCVCMSTCVDVRLRSLCVSVCVCECECVFFVCVRARMFVSV